MESEKWKGGKKCSKVQIVKLEKRIRPERAAYHSEGQSELASGTLRCKKVKLFNLYERAYATVYNGKPFG